MRDEHKPMRKPCGPLRGVTESDFADAKNVTAKGGVVVADGTSYYASGLDPEDVTNGNGHG